MIRLIVADDHEIVRGGLRRILEMEKDIEVLADTGGGREAVRLCQELKPDVLLLDLEMPDLDGMEVTRQVKAASPEVNVLVLTMFGHEEYAVRILEAGGSGFAVKGISMKELPEAIRKVAAGGKYIAPSIMEKTFMRQKHVGQENPLSLLSEREVQIFMRIARGDDLQKIACELCLSDSSVRTYKKRVMEKLGFENIADLIRFAIRNDLLSKF